MDFSKLDIFIDNGMFVKKDIQKAIQNYEIAAQMGNKIALNNLGVIYWKEEGFKDFEKSANYFFQSFLKGDEDAKENLINLLSENKVEWKKEYHKFWKCSPLLIERKEKVVGKEEKREISIDEQIMTILLISKKRRTSKYPHISFFVHGIAMNVVKFLCQSCQIKLKDEEDEDEDE